MKHKVVGIDLGTTYSAVAAFDHFTEAADILINRLDGRTDQTVPSVVSLVPGGRAIVGEVARRGLCADPGNTIIEIKREMGEDFRQETLEKYGARAYAGQPGFRPGNPQAGIEGDPVRVWFANDWYMPQEISALILMKMKQVAEANLGEEIRDAVITVPAYFTEKQKKATEEAALLAGLYPRQLIPEPTAAAICYGVDSSEATRKVYLIYDLGGGTFDVSIITVEGKTIDVIATSGDPRLGGGDFDDLITAWAVDVLKQQHGLDVNNDPLKKATIKYHAEKLKRDLSFFPTAKLVLPELRPENPPVLELSREQFEQMIEPLLRKSLNCVDVAIQQAQEKKGLRREDIDAILLVGGSSKIGRVKAKLLDYFQKDEKFVRADCDPDAVVARGAARMALSFQPSPPPFDIGRKNVGGINTASDNLDVQLITEHSLGVRVQNNIFHKIIDQGSRIPISKTDSNFTNAGPTRHVEVQVYQGEGESVFQNSLIGNLVLGPMEEKPKDFHKFEVTFSLDLNGLLSMDVHHVNTGLRYHAKFDQKTGIGGEQKLAMVRNKLLALYQGPAAGAAVPVPGQAVSPVPGPTPATAMPTGVPVAPVSPGGMPAGAYGAGPRMPPTGVPPEPTPRPVPGGYSPTAAGPMPGQPGQPMPPSERVSPVDMPPGQWPPQPSPQASPTMQPAPMPAGGPTAPPAAAAGAAALVDITAPVPEKHESILRRAKRQLQRQPNPDLLKAYNALAAAVNAGRPEDERNDFHDELEDAYLDARR